ncbi:hypothetical protein HK096_000114, partial [Nowakowskiella sp. JEL0078]
MDLEAQDSVDWQVLSDDMLSLAAETLNMVFNRNKSLRAGIPFSNAQSTLISTNTETLKVSLTKLEQNLSHYEQSASVDIVIRREWEDAILKLNKQIDRIEFLQTEEIIPEAQNSRNQLLRQPQKIVSNSPRQVRFQNTQDEPEGSLDEQELLTLQSRMMSDQDSHLDVLGESISRHKLMGLQISDELDLHVNLLEDTQDRVDNTQSRLTGASRRLKSIERGSGGESNT